MKRFRSLSEAVLEGYQVYDETTDEYVMARWREQGVAADFAIAPKPPANKALENAIRNLHEILKNHPFGR